MTTATITKGEMINQIIGLTKTSAIAHKIIFDGGDLFFSLAFRTEKELKQLCKKLNITTKK
jgi:hypothetical protein